MQHKRAREREREREERRGEDVKEISLLEFGAGATRQSS